MKLFAVMILALQLAFVPPLLAQDPISVSLLGDIERARAARRVAWQQARDQRDKRLLGVRLTRQARGNLRYAMPAETSAPKLVCTCALASRP